MRNGQRHHKSSDCRHRPHPAETHWAAVKNLIRKNRHQCRRAAKQNGKQIQRNRGEDYLSSKHKSQAGHETFPGARIALLSFLRSEEHTSELQSHSDLVCRLLLEKKKK